MEKKTSKFYVVDKATDGLEFIITESEIDEGTKYVLSRSKNETWSDTAKGNVLVTMINDGNGYKFKYEHTDKNRLGYDEIEHVYLLINHVRLRENAATYNVCQYK